MPRAYHPLRVWLAKEGMTQNELAEELGVAPNTVSRWVLGQKWPSREAMRKLFERTGGEITPTDMCKL